MRCLKRDLSIPEETRTVSYVNFPFSSAQEESNPFPEMEEVLRRLKNMEKEDIAALPLQQELRSKYGVKCAHCNALLEKPQIQPLLGDSSLSCLLARVMTRVKGKEAWLRVSNLALFMIPQVSIQRVEGNVIFLHFYNVASVFRNDV